MTFCVRTGSSETMFPKNGVIIARSQVLIKSASSVRFKKLLLRTETDSKQNANDCGSKLNKTQNTMQSHYTLYINDGFVA